MHYTDNQLCELLDDESVDLSSSDLSHLEECEVCRARLATLCGEGAWLDDWMDSVGDVTSEHAELGASRSSNSVVITVESSDQMNDRLECDTVRLDFLDTPTHPELLGRLGRYDIERLIGMGGYGIVFKARDSELNRVVAIKVLAPHLISSGPARQRFAREAQASAAVVHDHVVPIYDVVNDANLCYFVMQYIAGQSLQERVDRHGPLATDDVLRIAAQTAAGLHAAHEQGLIHRDVKPGNVLLEDTVNRVMISDFGLARASDDASITRSGTITGTPHYMSPEQARGQAIDARSDLFSLGSVIYFMSTGRSPFRAPQMMAVLNRICHEPYRPIEEVNPQVPYELTKLVDRLLCKRPEGRFSSAHEVHGKLQSLLSDYQSGKLRPRRFKALKAVQNPQRLAAAAILLATAAVFAVFGFPSWRGFSSGPDSGSLAASPEVAPDVELREESSFQAEWRSGPRAPGSLGAVAPPPSDSPSELMSVPPSYGPNTLTNRYGSIEKKPDSVYEQYAQMATKIDTVERLSTSFSTPGLNGEAVWLREIMGIQAAITKLESELARDEEMTSCDDCEANK